jgi:hypothetical protein
VTRWSVVAFTLALVSCDSDLMMAGPIANCTEPGVQCQLSGGPLGVCERSPCEAGKTRPCFQCTPQH